MSNFAGIPEERVAQEKRFCRRCLYFKPAHPSVSPQAGVCSRFNITANPTGYTKYDTKIGTCFVPKQ